MDTRESTAEWRQESRIRSIVNTFVSSLSALKAPVVALPSIIYFILHLSIMFVYLNLQIEAFQSFWALFVGRINPEIFTHYPHHIILMQSVLGRFDIFLDIFIHIIIQGATVIMVGTFLTGGNPSAFRSFSLTLSRYGHLLAVSIISSGAIFLTINISEMVASYLNPGVRLIAAGISVIIALMIQAVFVYTTPFILLESEDAFSSIRRSYRLALSFAPLTSLLVIIPFVLTLPSVLLDIKAEMIAFRLSPDFIIYNHAMGELLQTIATYLITAGSAVIVIKYRRKLLDDADDF